MSDLPPLPDAYAGELTTAEDALDEFSAASGILRARPRAVAMPADAADVSSLVRWAAGHDIPIIPRGAGTGMPGGNIGDGISVDLVTGFRGIEPPDLDRMMVRVEPGVTLAELNAVCRPAGIHLPVDPSSGHRCTIGGMIANNSAGAHSVRYGATRPWVESVDVVLADGTIATLRRGHRADDPRVEEIASVVDSIALPDAERIEARWPQVRKNSSGYALLEYLRSGDLLDLIVGSEGTLAIVTAAEVRLAPIPARRTVVLLEFDSLEAATETIAALLPLRPATCEMLDRTFLDLVRSGSGDTPVPLAPDLEAVLLVEVEGDSDDDVAAAAERIAAEARAAVRVSIASSPEQQDRFWELRHAASPIIAARAGGRRSMQFIEDSVVPVRHLPDYIRLLRDTLDRHGLPAVVFGHAGDGNLHVNPLVDTAADGWREMVYAVMEEVAHGVARLGGTLAGEHGDGRLRAPFLQTIWGREMVERFQRVKTAFDPRGILNPGVIIPLPGQHPFDALPLE